MTLFEAVDFAAACGFEGVEPYPIREFSAPDIKFAKTFKEYCDTKHLSIPCFSMGARLETDEYQKSVEELKKYAEVAAALNSPYLHHTLVPTLGRSGDAFPNLKAALPQLVEACGDVAKWAQPMGVTCIYEDQGYVINGINAYSTFYESLLQPAKGVVADTGNILFVDESIEAFCGVFGAETRHVHIKDYLRKAGGVPPGNGWYQSRGGMWLRGTAVGHGVTEFVPTIKILLESGYTGWWSIELDGPEDPLWASKISLANLHYYYDEAVRQVESFAGNEVI